MTAYYLIKSRHHFADKGQSYGFFFPVAMYRCESGTIKKAEHQRIDAFELLCWRRHLRECLGETLGQQRRSNQSILKEINLEYSLEGHADAPVFWPLDVKS